VAQDLREAGWTVGENTVAKVMAEHVSAYDLTCRCGYDLMCRSVFGES
jgi:hypothetical protein